jgi:microcystin degradation protein MlrC
MSGSTVGAKSTLFASKVMAATVLDLFTDPEAVARAQAAGPGAELALTLGGRQMPALTPPLPVMARVLRLHDGAFRCAGPVLRGVEVQMGPVALLQVDGVRVVVASRALAVTDVNLFHSLGIDPATLTTITLKSRNHHRAAFGPLARRIVLVDAGGIATMRLDSIDYRNLTRPIWPLDPDAHSDAIRILEFAPHVDHAP